MSPRPPAERVARNMRLRPEVDARFVALAAEWGLSLPEAFDRLLAEHDGVASMNGRVVVDGAGRAVEPRTRAPKVAAPAAPRAPSPLGRMREDVEPNFKRA